MRSSQKLADLRQELLGIPAALRETLTKGHREFEALIRETRWGQGPIYIVGSGASFIAGLAGARAFESALGRPAICRAASDFQAYSMPLVQPHSLLLAISYSGADNEVLEMARAARRRGAKILALTGSATNELATMSHGVLLVRAGDEQGLGVRITACEQAALIHISLLSASLLQRPNTRIANQLTDLEKLPEQAEWVLLKTQDAMRSLAAELNAARSSIVAGAGFYHTVALHWAGLLHRVGGKQAIVVEPADLLQCFSYPNGTEAALVVLSGSQCRLKRELHEFVASLRKSIPRVLAITDAADRELISTSSLAVLLPPSNEMISSMLALVALWSAASECRSQGNVAAV
jgi:glucosamine--fructose-6-phosphate aminotransferase (isomerizing)